LTKETVFWQCLETWSSESFPNEIPMVFRFGIGLTTEMYLKKLIQTCRQTLSSPDSSEQRRGLSTISSSVLDDIRSQWRSFIEYYSSYDLTKDSDIFVALQGIAQDIIVDTLGDHLKAGLSESKFTEDLCWTVVDYSNPHQKLEKWRAPSWSWGSTKDPVRIPRYTAGYQQTRRDLIRIVTCNVPTKPSGELISAFLSIECKPIPTRIQQCPWRAKILLFGIEQHLDTIFVAMDEPCSKEEEEEEGSRSIYLMPVAYSKDNAEARDRLEGVALEICDENGQRYRRIGYFEIGVTWNESPDYENSKEVFRKAMSMVEEAETCIIEIV
jgi:hypothetical protein